MNNDQAVHAPKSSSHMGIEEFAYVESYDAIADSMYAFVIYKETRTSAGTWTLKIKSANTAGTVYDPNSSALKNSLRKAAAQGEEYLIWGFNLKPKDTDPRLVENRLFFDESGNPTKLELHLITRKADGSALPEQVATVNWPE